MIRLDLQTESSTAPAASANSAPGTVLDNALKAAANINAQNIKDAWNDPKKNYYDKAKDIKDELTNPDGTNKIGKQTDRIDKVISQSTVNTPSIIARARNSVLQFPIYVTQSIRVNEAHIISKLFERVYTTLVQTVLSHNQIIDEEEAANLVFLKRFHTNLRESTEALVNKYYQPIDDLDQMMCESIFYSSQITNNLFVEFRVVPATDEDLIMENTRLANEPLTGFMYLREADDKNKDKNKKDQKPHQIPDTSRTQPEIIVEDEALEKIAQSRGITLEELKASIKKNPENGMGYGDRKIIHRRNSKGESEYVIPKIPSVPGKRLREPLHAPAILKDQDIRKVNGMLPYTIEVTFRLRKTNGDLDRDVKYVIGIKSIMHLISVKDLSEDLRNIITGDVKTLQHVRYKTGEISFKDYWLNIKGIKADAAKHVHYDKRWINTLKRLGEYNKMHGSLMKKPIELITGGHAPIPNGTLVLSQADVITLVNETGINLSIVANAKKLAKTLFLIGVVIVDSSAGSMRVLFPDSDNTWDIQSMSSIDADLNKTDNSQLMKEINQTMYGKR